MKRFALFFVLIMTLISSCFGGDSKDPAKQILRGTAATGSYFPDGSVVELRATAVDGVPSEILTSSVVGNEGEYQVEVTGLTAPFLVRVYDSAASRWYYSYTDGTVLKANANPYTDMLVRQWYNYRSVIHGNPMNVDIDDIFTPGVYPPGTADIVSLHPSCSSGFLPDNTPINIPDDYAVQRASTILSSIISSRYNVALEDVLVDSWVAGQGFDALLDSIGEATLSVYIVMALSNVYLFPEILNDVSIYFDDSTGKFHAEFWTAYGNPTWIASLGANMEVRINWGDPEVLITKQADSTAGNNHFLIETAFTSSSLVCQIEFFDFADIATSRVMSFPTYHR
ncbi:MAG: hypothetical protein EPN93_17545 [Spirochaetes bacterium]|nr:MAG: hypothetical protein EPN93_17545 [Spirochaetota bacterium]